jgi:hexosaminidase
MLIPIIPKPNNIKLLNGSFLLSNTTEINHPESLSKKSKYLHDEISSITGFNLCCFTIEKTTAATQIKLLLDPSQNSLGNEGYSLLIRKNMIELTAINSTGIFYGIQTILQILMHLTRDKNKSINSITIPSMEIIDKPRFGWRGFMLDEARHFQGKDTVKSLLDIMSLFKMNKFHWHLTDDQGWRIEIKKYPLLTETGSVRTFTQRRPFSKKDMQHKEHRGFYNQSDIRDILEYASDRNIDVIPEIDMPGHIMSALASYPELGCTGGPYTMPGTFGIFKDVLCVGKEDAYTFALEVLEEITNLFTSNIIHIGGDEVPKKRWKSCPRCRAEMKSNNLKTAKKLHVYFSNRIAAYLKTKNRTAMGWNQILDDDLLDSVIGQYWILGRKKIISHLEKGRKFVMSPFFYTYLDYNYDFLPLKKCYNYNPVPEKLHEKHSNNILGIEAPLWTEWITNRFKLNRHVFPRLLAVAETGWTLNEIKDFNDFIIRLIMTNNILESRNIVISSYNFRQHTLLKRVWNILRKGILKVN